MAPPPVSGPSGAAWLLVNMQSIDGEVAVAHVERAALAVVPSLRAGRRRGRDRFRRRRLAIDEGDVLQGQAVVVAPGSSALLKLRICTAPPPSSVILSPPSMTVFLLVGRFSVAVTAIVTGAAPQLKVMMPAARDRRLQLRRTCSWRAVPVPDDGGRVRYVGGRAARGHAGPAGAVGIAGQADAAAVARGGRGVVVTRRAAALVGDGAYVAYADVARGGVLGFVARARCGAGATARAHEHRQRQGNRRAHGTASIAPCRHVTERLFDAGAVRRLGNLRRAGDIPTGKSSDRA